MRKTNKNILKVEVYKYFKMNKKLSVKKKLKLKMNLTNLLKKKLNKNNNLQKTQIRKNKNHNIKV